MAKITDHIETSDGALRSCIRRPYFRLRGMRRDYFTLNVAGVTADESGPPVVTITYEGPPAELKQRLERDDSVLDADEIDVAYRLQDRLEKEHPDGVVAIADRFTGEYVLELNTDAESILAVTDAVSGDESDGQYRIVIRTDEGDQLATYEKSTLLIYDLDGDLLREQSLIPSGVEI